MFWPLGRYLLVGCVFTLFVPGSIFAASSDTAWTDWFITQIDQHPDIVAARERMNSLLSTADNLEQPLYNPEFESEYEREEKENNYRIGISQTVDWWDKRGVREQQAKFNQAAARNAYQSAKQQKIAQALATIIKWHATSQAAELALEQESQLGTLLDLVQERQKAGDMGQTDAELTYLGLSQRLNDTARALAQLKRVEAALYEQLPDWSAQWSQIPESLWATSQTTADARWLDEHPEVLAVRGEWEVLRQAAELARRETKADPTFGFNAGQSTDGDVAAVTFSIPLNVRNNFSALARAASQEALSAEARYRAVRRKQQAAIDAAQAALQAYQRQYLRWKTLMAGRGERSANLLEKQWAGGDFSTTEYLLALQQRAEGLNAGIELSMEFQLTRIEWLLQTGQITAALMQPTQ